MNYELGKEKRISRALLPVRCTQTGRARLFRPRFYHNSLFLIPNSSPRGVSLVEVVVGTALLLLAFTGLITAYNVFTKAGLSTMYDVQSSYLLEEGIEAVTSFRDFGWTANIANLTSGTKYYLNWNGSRWISTATAGTIDNTYTRYFTTGNVYRDTNDNITGSGTLDSGTKQVTVVVSWQNGAITTSRSLSTYLTNLFNN